MLIPLTFLPAINACLNATSAILLSLGYLCIRSKKILAHRICMSSAVLTSAAFLILYLYYHYHAGTTRYAGGGWLRPLYFGILISHTALAAAIVPLVLLTLARALRGDFPRHVKIARWTLPLWFYVSVTGVIIYSMLYNQPAVDAWR